MPPGVKKPAICLDSCKETFKGLVHGFDFYYAEVGPKGLALSRFPVIKKKSYALMGDGSLCKLVRTFW